MSDNPFENEDVAVRRRRDGGSYLSFLRDQLKHLEVGESVKIDLGKEYDLSSRPYIRKAIRPLKGWRVLTKLDTSRNLWVKRVE